MFCNHWSDPAPLCWRNPLSDNTNLISTHLKPAQSLNPFYIYTFKYYLPLWSVQTARAAQYWGIISAEQQSWFCLLLLPSCLSDQFWLGWICSSSSCFVLDSPLLPPPPRPSLHRPDAQRALLLLEEYRAKLNHAEDRQLRHSIQRVIDIFQSNLFQALIGTILFVHPETLYTPCCVLALESLGIMQNMLEIKELSWKRSMSVSTGVINKTFDQVMW